MMISTIKKTLLCLFAFGVALGSVNTQLNAQGKNDDVSILPADFIKDITDENFQETVEQGVVVVDFWAEWCVPCKRFTPIFENVAKQLFTKATFAKVNVDNAVKTARQLNISSIPTVLIFKNGKVVDQRRGAFGNEESFRAFILPHLESK